MLVQYVVRCGSNGRQSPWGSHRGPPNEGWRWSRRSDWGKAQAGQRHRLAGSTCAWWWRLRGSWRSRRQTRQSATWECGWRWYQKSTRCQWEIFWWCHRQGVERQIPRQSEVLPRQFHDTVQKSHLSARSFEGHRWHFYMGIGYRWLASKGRIELEAVSWSKTKESPAQPRGRPMQLLLGRPQRNFASTLEASYSWSSRTHQTVHCS